MENLPYSLAQQIKDKISPRTPQIALILGSVLESLPSTYITN